jgi:hypothetical protein
MVASGIDKVYRDTIIVHSLKGMDVNYIVPTEKALTYATEQYTNWFDNQIEAVFENVDQIVDQKQN